MKKITNKRAIDLNGKRKKATRAKKTSQTRPLTQSNDKLLPQTKKSLRVKKAGSPSRPVLTSLLFDNRINENLIDVETLGKICGVAPKTIHNWVYLRSIPYIKVGRKVMFRPKSFITWFNRKEFKP